MAMGSGRGSGADIFRLRIVRVFGKFIIAVRSPLFTLLGFAVPAAFFIRPAPTHPHSAPGDTAGVTLQPRSVRRPSTRFGRVPVLKFRFVRDGEGLMWISLFALRLPR